jgi:hypothetical protein
MTVPRLGTQAEMSARERRTQLCDEFLSRIRLEGELCWYATASASCRHLLYALMIVSVRHLAVNVALRG